MILRNKIKLVLVFSMIFFVNQSGIWSQTTSLEKKRANKCSNSCFGSILPKSGELFGNKVDTSDVHYSATLESLLGSKANFYKKLGFIRMMEAQYDKDGNKFSVQIFEFRKFKQAMRTMLIEKPQWGGKMIDNFYGKKIVPRGYMHFHRKILAGVRGVLYYKVKFSVKNGASWKAAQSLYNEIGKGILNVAKKSNVALYRWVNIKKAFPKYFKMVKMNIRASQPVFFQKKEYPSALSFFPETIGVTEKSKNKKTGKIYRTSMLIFGKAALSKLKYKNYGQKKILTFLKKYTNRFRYYKYGKGKYIIVGVYKNKVLAIFGNRYPAGLKKNLEKFRIKYFF